MEALEQDDDLVPLLQACRNAGLDACALAWDDPTVSWGRFDLVLLRSPWDYTGRHEVFIRWCEHVDRISTLLNPLEVVRWNSDKHYLRDLAARGVPVVAVTFVEPEQEPLPCLQAFLSAEKATEFVVKPAISAGARDTQRYARKQEFAASNHIARLLDEGRSVMLQPYLESVDNAGETGLIHLDGRFSHAIRKGPLLPAEGGAALAGHESISPRDAEPDELAVAWNALETAATLLHLGAPLAYARIDLIRDGQGQPRVLELELVEPSLFFAHAPGSADRFAANLVARLQQRSIRARTDPP